MENNGNTIHFEIERPLTDEEKKAVLIVETLQDAGFEAYFAGGSVRDELLGLKAHDIDIATSAKPEEVGKLFSKSYDRGKEFGVVAILMDEDEFEVTTFREDVGISDHRRPSFVKFSSAEIDASRRDFTINGLFYDPIKKEIIDFVDGIRDIKRKLIRFIGKPEERIAEDYLRILRAVRFACRLDFKIEEDSELAIQRNASKIKEISSERIRDEFTKILLCQNRTDAICEMQRLGLIQEILPELMDAKNVPQPPEFHAEGDVLTHILLALKNIDKPYDELVWAVLLHDICKPETIGFRSKVGKTSITFFDHDVRSAEKAKEILERFKFSHHFINAVTWAISQHMRIVGAFRGMSERKQKKLFCDPNIILLLDLTEADLSASLRPNGKPEMDMYEDAVKLKEKFERESSEEEKQQLQNFDLITGDDIIETLKIEPSPEVGRIKTEIEKEYFEGKINTREEALKLIEKFRNN
jgi:poly(A) polymerase